MCIYEYLYKEEVSKGIEIKCIHLIIFFIVITQLNIPLALLYLTIQSYMIADMQI